MARTPEDLQVIYDALYSAEQVALLLHLDKRDLRRLIDAGEIPYVRLNDTGRIRFPGWQLRSWLDGRMKRGSPA